ncbi:L-rhamnose mutarotase [Bartonella sp. HY329]|uniref:L-rhamnose mutarotase n=1 Tax=unclassified Bartonella TaxID=2645622 RepID=UPI0021C59E33|nr:MULTISPECIES: L-rhamnose mutarotase [unclassified Bartonella]UXM94893.1 L-rhamnose mutarotase [Bartonella sp. HY329]UXN09216.1 L-rhamnose mutarotase [Bartonella sp. HY328]
MKYVFRMQLHQGMMEEYKRRHDLIWPDLVDLLHEAGIADYSIYLDPQTYCLFAIMERQDPNKVDNLSNHPIMKRWWAYMADIMATNADGSPVEQPLVQMFHME